MRRSSHLGSGQSASANYAQEQCDAKQNAGIKESTIRGEGTSLACMGAILYSYCRFFLIYSKNTVMCLLQLFDWFQQVK